MASCGNENGVEQDGIVMERKPKYDHSQACVKCKIARGNLVIRHVVYCKGCFVSFVTVKFKRCLTLHINPGQARAPRRTILRASGDLLLGYSGGVGSTMLLDLVHSTYFAQNKDAQNHGGSSHPGTHPVWYRGYVCYVETCAASPEMSDQTAQVQKIVSRFERLELLTLRLEDAFDHEWWSSMGKTSSQLAVNLSGQDLPIAPAQSTSLPKEALQAYLLSLPTPTARDSAIQVVIRVLLLYTAAHHRCSHVLLGSSLTSLAIGLISGVSTGGGYNIPEEIYEEWTDATRLNFSLPPTKIVRPLREVGMKECLAWVWWRKLEVASRIGSSNLVAQKANSIIRLTRDFIMGLETDFPSTVSTITRTCAKLASKKNEANRRCVLCERPMQRDVQEWKSLISVYSFDESSDHRPIRSSPSVTLTPSLCYSCHTTYTSRGSGIRGPSASNSESGVGMHIPLWVSSHITGVGADSGVFTPRSMRREEMRDALKDVLLEDADE